MSPKKRKSTKDSDILQFFFRVPSKDWIQKILFSKLIDNFLVVYNVPMFTFTQENEYDF